MKKIAVLAALLACAAAAAWQLLPRPTDRLYYADHLPAETVATLSLFDLKGLAKTFPDSAPGRFFSKPVMRAILAEQKMDEEAILRYEALHDSLADILTNPFFQLLFGDDVTFALLPPDPALLKTDPVQALRDSLIAFGSSPAAGIVGGIASTLSSEFSQETVNGLALTRLRLEDDFLYGCGKDGVLLLAFNPERIAAALAQKATIGLREQPFFLAAKNFWQEETAGRRLLHFSLNPEQLRPVLVAASPQAEAQSIAGRLEQLRSLSGLITEQQDGLKLSIHAAEHSLTAMRVPASDHKKALALLTETAPLYLWTAALDKQAAETVLTWADVRPETLRQELGLSLEEIMAAAGPQAGLAMSGIASAGLFPLPKLTLFLQMRQPETARLLMEQLRRRISRQGFAKEQTAAAGGHAIHYWRLLPAEAAQPAVALTDNILYIANGPAGLKALLTEEQAGLSPAARDSLGPELADQLAAASLLTFAARPSRLAAEAHKAKDWLTAALAGTRAGEAERLREEILILMQAFELAAAWANADGQAADASFFLRPASRRKEEK